MWLTSLSERCDSPTFVFLLPFQLIRTSYLIYFSPCCHDWIASRKRVSFSFLSFFQSCHRMNLLTLEGQTFLVYKCVSVCLRVFLSLFFFFLVGGRMVVYYLIFQPNGRLNCFSFFFFFVIFILLLWRERERERGVYLVRLAAVSASRRHLQKRRPSIYSQ